MCFEFNGSYYFKDNGDYYRVYVFDSQGTYTIYYAIKDNDGLTTEQKNELSKLSSNTLESNNDYIIIENENIIYDMYDIFTKTNSNTLRSFLQNAIEEVIFSNSNTQDILKRILSSISKANQDYLSYIIDDINSIVSKKGNFKDLMIIPFENDYYIILPSEDNILLGHS